MIEPQEIIDKYKETFYTDDEESIIIVASILIGSKLKTPPVWLYLVGGSSSGKSTLIEAFGKVPFITQVSDLTTNTFLSGMKSSTKETSLLKRLGQNFVITMKDFTTILEKSDDSQSAIISQMREIYDGSMTKETGTGETISWGVPIKGKATFIMAATEGIYTVQEKFADMGTRAINYVLKPVEGEGRRAFTRRSIRNNNKLEDAMEEIQDLFASFVMERIENLPRTLPEVDEETEDKIIEVADFCSMARSVVKRDYRGVKTLALSPEMPGRMAKQMVSQIQVIRYLFGGKAPQKFEDAVYKTAFDSIIKQRRLVIEQLARYYRVTKAGLSDLINYPPERCEEWLEDLHMFKIIQRQKQGNQQYWKLKDEWRDIVCKYLHIRYEEIDLEGEDEYDGEQEVLGDYGDTYEDRERKQLDDENANKIFDNF